MHQHSHNLLHFNIVHRTDTAMQWATRQRCRATSASTSSTPQTTPPSPPAAHGNTRSRGRARSQTPRLQPGTTSSCSLRCRTLFQVALPRSSRQACRFRPSPVRCWLVYVGVRVIWWAIWLTHELLQVVPSSVVDANRTAAAATVSPDAAVLLAGARCHSHDDTSIPNLHGI